MSGSNLGCAVKQGAVVVNDVSGGLADPAMHRTVADLGVVYVAMHWRGHADVMESHATYDDVVAGTVRYRYVIDTATIPSA